LLYLSVVGLVAQPVIFFVCDVCSMYVSVGMNACPMLGLGNGG